MEQTVLCLVLVLLSLATAWGQMEIPCTVTCAPGSAAPGLQTSSSSSSSSSSPDMLCCPVGFSRTVVQDKCTCSIPLPAFFGPTGTPDLGGLTAAQLFQYQAELLDYIRRLAPALPTPAEKLPKFIPAV